MEANSTGGVAEPTKLTPQAAQILAERYSGTLNSLVELQAKRQKLQKILEDTNEQLEGSEKALGILLQQLVEGMRDAARLGLTVGGTSPSVLVQLFEMLEEHRLNATPASLPVPPARTKRAPTSPSPWAPSPWAPPDPPPAVPECSDGYGWIKP